MILLALGVWESTLLRAALILALIWLVLWLMNRHYRTEEDKRSDRLQKQYEVLTAETLSAVPDEELVEAVVANLNAKQDPKRPDPYATLPLLSRGRILVYSVWLIHKELDTGDFDTLLESPSAVFGDYAASVLDLLGAHDCAAAVRQGLSSEDAAERADCHASYLEAAEREKPLSLCVDYIRTNPNEFLDDVPDTGVMPDAEATGEDTP